MTTSPQARRAKAQRVADFGTTVFTVWTQIAKQHDAINLGQGFPDFAAPDFVMKAGQEALVGGYQQYSPLAGMPTLRRAIAAQAQRDWGREVDPDEEITVTVGATEGIYAGIQALVDPGDEVLLIEPFYDSYTASVTMAGGVPKAVPLRPTDEGTWALDFDEFRKAITPRTKLLMLNTPHNPTGKVFTREELETIATICQEHDIYVIADEVYDRLVYDDNTHISIGTLPGMWDRTLTLSSVGKTFSVTGWKIGWAIGGASVTDALRMAHQWIPFSTATPLQGAIATVLDACATNGYYEKLRAMYQQKRDILIEALRAAGLRPLVPQGTYFIMADTSGFDPKDDDDFCLRLTQEYGVTAIPPGSFYLPEHKHLAHRLARFAFCKEDHMLQAAAKALTRKKATPS